ncbi:MAG: hypothetical protein SGPRY_003605 [Prymnesium sp.]
MGGGSKDDVILPALENTVLGVVSGTIEVTLLQPMLYCKNASQQGLPFTLNPRVLYRGLGMSVLNMSVLTGVQFPLTGSISKMITGGSERTLSPSEKIASGFMGGAISGIICAPMELVMIQQQRFGASLVGATGRIVSEYGPATLFRGLSTACGREGLFTAGYLGMGPVFGEKLQKDFGVSKATGDFLGASGAGMIAATLSHPLDTAKTCMQGDVEQKTYVPAFVQPVSTESTT